jgi:hypothetical protein
MDAYEADKEKIQNNEIFPRFPSLTTPYDHTQSNTNKRPQIYELFIQFIKLSEILGRILQGLHTPRAKKYSLEHGSYDLVARLDYELTEWRYAFPTSLKNIQLPDFNQDVGHFAPAIASVLLFYFSSLILLHQPFIRRTVSRSSYTSQQICSSAATRGMRIASRLTARDFLMCPYSFTLYPIMQCGLIHMYNGKNADPQTSSLAKLYLKRGTELLERLQHMSRTASRMYKVFKSITENADLHAAVEDDHVERNLAEEESHLEENIRRIQERAQKENLQDRPSMSSIMNSVMLQKPTMNYAEVEAVLPPVNAIPPPFQPQLLPGVNEEAFSLTQFGFNTTNETSALDFILQNVNTLAGFTENSPVPSTQDVIFRNDPNSVFWDLPAAFDWDQLSHWVNNVNDNIQK